MLPYIVRRVVISIPLLLIASILVFVLVAESGDPLAQLRQNPNVPASTIKARAHALYLDRSLPVRYWHWLSNFVQGDFGKSSYNGINVRSDLVNRAGVTFRLILLAVILAVLLGVSVGVISAVKQYSPTDYSFTFTGFVFLSLPVFWFAAILKLFAIDINNWIGHDVLFTIGDSTPGLTGSFWDKLPNYAGHLALPTISLAMLSFAIYSRFQRASMLDVLNSDYIRLARAKGLSNRRVMVRHALRTALIPLVTIVAIDIGSLLSGAVVTETVFVWHGLGEMLINGILRQDLNVVLAWLMLAATFVVLFNLIADILYGFLDPRIRYG